MAAENDDEIEGSRAPLVEHLIELRNRLVWSLVALLAAFCLCYAFAEEIFAFLTEPLANAFGPDHHNRRMIYTSLTETFFTYIKVSFFTALFISFPIIANQIWKFVAPGLYRNERGAFMPYLVATPVLFFIGGAMVYYVIFPLAWRFFLGFETPNPGTGLPIELEAKVGEYLSLVIKLIFAFGLFFQMPVLLSLLARAGIVTAAGLAAKRKYAIVILFALAAVLTPPDVISQVGLAVPGLLLYEISILLARGIERKREERDADLA